MTMAGRDGLIIYGMTMFGTEIITTEQYVSLMGTDGSSNLKDVCPSYSEKEQPLRSNVVFTTD